MKRIMMQELEALIARAAVLAIAGPDIVILARFTRSGPLPKLRDAFEDLDSRTQDLVCTECPKFYAYLDPENDKENN